MRKAIGLSYMPQGLYTLANPVVSIYTYLCLILRPEEQTYCWCTGSVFSGQAAPDFGLRPMTISSYWLSSGGQANPNAKNVPQVFCVDHLTHAAMLALEELHLPDAGQIRVLMDPKALCPASIDSFLSLPFAFVYDGEPHCV